MRVVLIVLLVFQGLYINGQSTFNIRTRFGASSAVLTNVELDNDGYNYCGVGTDTIQGTRSGIHFGKLNQDGEVLHHQLYSGDSTTLEIWYKTMQPYQNGFVANCYARRGSELISFILYLDNNGLLIKLAEILNPYYPTETFIVPVSFEKVESNFYELYWIANAPGISNFYIRKLGSNFEEIWGIEAPRSNRRTRPFSMITGENLIVTGGVKDNLNTNRRDFIYRNYLLALDSNGVQQWEWQSPLGELWAGVHDMVLLEDGSIIIATMKGEEFPGNSNSGYVVWQKAIVKLDPQRNVEWGKIIDPESKSSYEIITMKQFSDNETAIMNGFHVIPYKGLNGYVRAIDQVNLMTKFSVTTGDIIWQRKLSYLDGGDKRHQIYDTEQTPDGGYIMVGESRDGSFPPNPPYPQQGWIIKVDSMGCLVPGCHTAVVEPSLGAATLKLFPNPATDYLNILLQVPAQHKDGQFRVIDLMGRVIATFPVSFQEGTAVLPVYDYVPGMYWLQYVEGAEVKVTKSFMVR